MTYIKTVDAWVSEWLSEDSTTSGSQGIIAFDQTSGSETSSYRSLAWSSQTKVDGREIRNEPPKVSQRAQVSKFLRECASKAQDLLELDDPRDVFLAGCGLQASIEQLWELRESRESDWGDAVNLLQVLLSGVDLESLSAAQKDALAKIFEDGLLVRAVGPSDVGEIAILLQKAGFDLWRGIEALE